VYYGTDLTFFVTPKKQTDDEKEEVIYGTYGNTIMDSMVKLLYTEKSIGMYLSGIEGVPAQPVYTEGMDLAVYEEQVKEYNKYISTLKKSLEFTYKMEEQSTDAESKNFIYVNIQILEEGVYTKEFTRQLLASLQKQIPIIVEGSMLNPDENRYSQTSCTLVTPLYPMVELMNPNYSLIETIKFAVLLAFAAFVVVCVIIIINDKMDKRIRNTEILESRLNVPLLGMIPSIDMSDVTEIKETAEITEGGESK
jgi:hypothetical protein